MGESAHMALIAYRETLTLEVRGKRLQLIIPGGNEEAQSFKQHHIARPYFEYEAVMAALLQRILAAIDVPHFFDVGAFIGYYSLLAGRILEGRSGRIWSVESNPRHIAALRDSIELNGMTNIEVVHAALSDKNEELYSRHEIVFSEKQVNGTAVQAVRADDLFARLGVKPNVVKVDVHGFEGRTLAGMRDALCGSINYLMLELHPTFYLTKVTPGVSRMQILDELESAGFNVYYVSGLRHPMAKDQRRLVDNGRFSYQRLTHENRGMLLFDRYQALFVMASKPPLETIAGPSLPDSEWI
jgi:FkbM family methyltransferase